MANLLQVVEIALIHVGVVINVKVCVKVMVRRRKDGYVPEGEGLL